MSCCACMLPPYATPMLPPHATPSIWCASWLGKRTNLLNTNNWSHICRGPYGTPDATLRYKCRLWCPHGAPHTCSWLQYISISTIPYLIKWSFTRTSGCYPWSDMLPRCYPWSDMLPNGNTMKTLQRPIPIWRYQCRGCASQPTPTFYTSTIHFWIYLKC